MHSPEYHEHSGYSVIQRIFRFASEIRHLLANCEPDLLKSALSSIALFSWSHDQRGTAPPLAFLKTMSQFQIGWKGDDVPPEEVAWRSLLEAYGYVETDPFDLVLLEGIKIATSIRSVCMRPHLIPMREL